MNRFGSSSVVNRLLFDSDRLTNIGLEIMLPVVQRAQQTGKLKTDMSFEMLVAVMNASKRRRYHPHIISYAVWLG